MKKYLRVIIAAILCLTTILSTTTSICASSIDNSYDSDVARSLVDELNSSSDPAGFWAELAVQDQELIIRSIAEETQIKTEITMPETFLEDNFSEVIITINGYYYDYPVWQHHQTVGWWYDYSQVTAYFRYSDGNGGSCGYIYWRYDGELSQRSGDDWQGSNVECWSTGHFTVYIWPGAPVLNTFENEIRRSYWNNGQITTP